MQEVKIKDQNKNLLKYTTKNSVQKHNISTSQNTGQSPQKIASYEFEAQIFPNLSVLSPQQTKTKCSANKLNWTKILYDHNIFIDSQAYRKWNNDLEFQGKQLLQKDLVRTRANEEFFQKQSTKEMIRRLCTFYCKNNKISYQQGLLEVVIPFVLLHRKDFELRKCYAYFNAFMRKHFPKVLTQRIIDEKKELPHAILAISLAQLLLRFHYPEIYSLFLDNQIYLSSILTQQILTVFAKNLQIALVYKVYDYFINKKDKNSILFMSIALIGMNEEEIQSAGMSDELPLFVNKDLKGFIKSQEQLEMWFQLSERIERETPPSFISFSRNLGFTNHSVLTRQDLIGMLKIEEFLTKQDYIMPIYLKQVMGKIEKQYLFKKSQNQNPYDTQPNIKSQYKHQNYQSFSPQQRFVLISIDGRSFSGYQSINLKKHIKFDIGDTVFGNSIADKSTILRDKLKLSNLTNIKAIKKMLSNRIAVLCETKQGNALQQRTLLIIFANKIRQSKQLCQTRMCYLQQKLGSSSQCIIF